MIAKIWYKSGQIEYFYFTEKITEEHLKKAGHISYYEIIARDNNNIQANK